MLKHNYAIISGSTRQKSQSKKVADHISTQLLSYSETNSVEIVDLSINIFPLWDEAIWSKGIDWHDNWAIISKKLQQSDGIVIIAPEWNGMVPPQLMNFFQLCSHQELSHKPSLIVSVSSTNGGTYPIAELRMNSFKNTKICYLPEHVIVRDVKNVLNTNEHESENDKHIRERLIHALSLLTVYTDAFKKIRDHELVKNFPFPYGM